MATVHSGDLILAVYSDSGNSNPIAIGDGAQQLGAPVQNTVAEESDQSVMVATADGSHVATFTSSDQPGSVVFAAIR